MGITLRRNDEWACVAKNVWFSSVRSSEVIHGICFLLGIYKLLSLEMKAYIYFSRGFLSRFSDNTSKTELGNFVFLAYNFPAVFIFMLSYWSFFFTGHVFSVTF